MSPRMFADYRDETQRMSDSLGNNTPVRNLRPLDFEGFADDLAKFRVHGRGIEVQRVRTIFKLGVKNEYITKERNYGTEFRKPGQDELRIRKAKTGKQLF